MSLSTHRWSRYLHIKKLFLEHTIVEVEDVWLDVCIEASNKSFLEVQFSHTRDR